MDTFKTEQREPFHQGEKVVKEAFDAYDNSNLKYWFALDYLPGVSDLDLLLFDKESGLFAVEIKAVPLSEIEEISLNSIVIRGRGKKKSTNEQAYDALIGLMNYANRKSVSIPFTVATSMWPKITRNDWKTSFRSNVEIRDLSEHMIFEDDLVSYSILQKRLSYIYRSPPIRKGSSCDYKYSESHISELYHLLVSDAVAPERPSCSKFQSIARNQRSSTLKKYPLNRPFKIVFEGIPGSGKTYSLLTLAQLHGTEGRAVLMLCFNKALATQLRVNVASIAEEIGDPELIDFINVVDVFQHASTCAGIFGIDGISKTNYLEWLELILDELKSKELPFEEFPDVLLVDEVQDFSTSEQKWIEYWASNSRWVGIARGVGQEIYSQYTVSKDSWFDNYKKESLTVNYRNPGKLFLLSSLLGATKLNPNNLRQIESKTALKLKKRELSIQRPEESGVVLKVVNDINERSLVESYIEVIRDSLSILNNNNTENFQLLVLARGKADRRRCQKALNLLRDQEGIDFIDLTEDKFRRVEPKASQIRLCTYESSRGLEAEVVVVVGFEQLVMDDEKDASLALVVLSRAITHCIVTIKKERGTHLPPIYDKFLASVERVLDDI